MRLYKYQEKLELLYKHYAKLTDRNTMGINTFEAVSEA